MGLGVSIFLIAVGAILTWAVNATVSGLELQTIGVILMVVGALGLVLSMIFWSSWGGFHGETRRTTVRRRPALADDDRSKLDREAARRPPLSLSGAGLHATGSSNENVEPCPGSDSSWIRLPIRCRISRQM